MAKQKQAKSLRRFIVSVAALNGLAALLLTIRIVQSDSSRYIFLYWNLILAALAPLIAWWLVVRLKRFRWSRPSQLGLTLLWLLFLPNSFYIMTDFIHLRETYEAPLIYDIALLMGFVASGLIAGYISVYLVHSALRQRLNVRHAWYVVSGVFLLSSFAIYLGRFSRWNTWDVILTPAGLLFDVSDRVVNPAAHSETYISTLTMCALLLAVYWIIWEAAEYVRGK